MKCTSRPIRKTAISLLICNLLMISGCGQTQYEMPYSVNPEVSSYQLINIEENERTATPFADNLCVINDDILSNKITIEASGAALFDIKNRNTIYAKNVHEKLYPASLTKVMTALVALKNGTNDMMLTASTNVSGLASDAQVCGIKPGDQMTLDQALHLLLINSANDAAIMIAEGIAGSVDGFSDMMNEEALAIGATNSHFVNPHGLPDDNHYTTVYDMYLIMNSAVEYELFNEIIHMSTYTTLYQDSKGNSKEVTVNSTNFYLQGTAEAPGGVTVLGGKTGTTNAAGHCLVLISRDASSNPYISVILRADSRENLYKQMTDLLSEISN